MEEDSVLSYQLQWKREGVSTKEGRGLNQWRISDTWQVGVWGEKEKISGMYFVILSISGSLVFGGTKFARGDIPKILFSLC